MEKALVVMEKPKVVFVLGATATGKSKLAIALAKRFNGEVINADKIQVHDGAPVITNKVTNDEMAGVPHHLLGVLPPDAEFTAEDFRREAAGAVARVLAAGRLPVVAGGSNTYIEELVDGDGASFRRAHDILFLWVDAAPELHEWYAGLRVDDMVARGLVAEARAAFDAGSAGYNRGLRRAIGLPEMHAYLLAEREGQGEAELAGMLARAVGQIKDNTCRLARAQVEKIRRLRTLEGWDVRRVDVTPVFASMAEGAAACDKKTWETVVWEPCEEMVRRFLLTTPAAPVVTVDGKEASPSLLIPTLLALTAMVGFVAMTAMAASPAAATASLLKPSSLLALTTMVVLVAKTTMAASPGAAMASLLKPSLLALTAVPVVVLVATTAMPAFPAAAMESLLMPSLLALLAMVVLVATTAIPASPSLLKRRTPYQ